MSYQQTSNQQNCHQPKAYCQLRQRHSSTWSQLITKRTLYHIIQFFLNSIQVFLFQTGGAKLLYGIQIFLHPIISGTVSVIIAAFRFCLGLSGRYQNKRSYRYRQNNAQPHAPIHDQKPHGHNHKHNDCAKETGNRIGKNSFQFRAVTHHGCCQIRQITLTEKCQWEPPQLFRQGNSPVSAFFVSHFISQVILNPLGYEDQQQENRRHQNYHSWLHCQSSLPAEPVQKSHGHQHQEGNGSHDAQMSYRSCHNPVL